MTSQPEMDGICWIVRTDPELRGYELALHKGYPTPRHQARLRALGPSPVHRRSFAPVRALLN